MTEEQAQEWSCSSPCSGTAPSLGWETDPIEPTLLVPLRGAGVLAVTGLGEAYSEYGCTGTQAIETTELSDGRVRVDVSYSDGESRSDDTDEQGGCDPAETEEGCGCFSGDSYQRVVFVDRTRRRVAVIAHGESIYAVDTVFPWIEISTAPSP